MVFMMRDGLWVCRFARQGLKTENRPEVHQIGLVFGSVLGSFPWREKRTSEFRGGGIRSTVAAPGPVGGIGF